MGEIPQLDPDREAYLDQKEKQPPVEVAAWPRKDKFLPKVQLPTDWVRFSVLNHRTTVEQLSYTQDTGQPNLFKENPLGPAAQRAQYEILKRQPGFDRLKADLRTRGQQDPAIITAEGVLINGNRRAAALRSLYDEDNKIDAQYIDCLVLPKDATIEEMIDLEAELQVAEDFRQPYSWIDDAFLIEHYLDRDNKDFAKVAERLHRKESDIKDQYEKLLNVRQLVEMSNGARRYKDFIENESAFTELSKHIRSKPTEKEAVKATYFLGILSDVEYRDLRNLRCEEAANLVLDQMKNSESCARVLEVVAEKNAEVVSHADDPLAELVGDQKGADASTSTVKDLLSVVAQKREEASLQLADGSKMEMPDVLSTLRTAIKGAANEAAEQERDKSEVLAPISRAKSALADLKRAKEALPKAQRHDEFDRPVLVENLNEILNVIDAIREKL